MTMREKIARAIHAKRFSASAWDEWVRIGADTSEYLSMADAVLDAMRSPTKEMVEAGGDALDEAVDVSAWSDCDGNRYSETTVISGYQTNIWQVMIDAAKGG